MTAVLEDQTTSGTPRWLQKIDDWTRTSGDWLNPILVKEARQALKSRQFVITFSLLLIAAWVWTAAAILILMPRIYYVPSGQTLLTGYFFTLALPMLLVVPIAAHRSLASELDDGTLDLLSVTNLSPIQIVTGKLASAALQMMLYIVTLLPCVAFSYVLRGVDVITIAGLIGLTISAATVLTLVGLFLAALPKGRAGQLMMLVGMLIIVVIAQYAVGAAAMEMLYSNFFRDGIETFITFTLMAVAITITLGLVLLRAAAAELSPPSENRSTPIRKALLWHQTVVIGCFAYVMLDAGRSDIPAVLTLSYGAIFWLFVGCLMVGESGVLTPRVRRDLPASLFSRGLFSWLTPGPGTGLVFAIIAYGTLAFSVLYIRLLAPVPTTVGFITRVDPVPFALTFLGYMMLILTITRAFMWLIRRRSNTHPAVALALMVIVCGLLAVIPYSVALWFNDYRTFSWNYGQITNWAWTLGLLFNESIQPEVPFVIFALGGLVWLLALMLIGRRVLPMRVATPERVLRELGKLEEKTAAEVDPLAG